MIIWKMSMMFPNLSREVFESICKFLDEDDILRLREVTDKINITIL